MFCQKCGTAVAEAVLACPSCSLPIAGLTSSSPSVAERVKATSRDALSALKTFAGNPVAGLPQAYEALGEARAFRAGIAFGVVSLACFLLGGYLMLPPFVKQDLLDFLGFGGVLKCLLFAVVPFLCTVVGGLGMRKVSGQGGSLGGDCFVAGAALLPSSFAMLLGGLLGLANAQVVLALTVFAGCVGILMLFSGFTRISRLSERAGTVGVPIVVLLSAWLAKVLASSVLGGPGSSGPSGFGGLGY